MRFKKAPMLNLERPKKQISPPPVEGVVEIAADEIEEVPEEISADEVISEEGVELPTKTDFEWLKESVASLAPKESGAELAAKGGEHLVLEFDHRDVVYKVNYFESLPKPRPDLMLPSARKSNQDYLTDVKRERRKRIGALRKHFGFNAVPAEIGMVRDLPINHTLLQQLRPWWNVNNDMEIPKTFPAFVVIQRKVDLDPKNTFSLDGYYLEAPRQPLFTDGSSFTDEQYASIHALLTQEQSERPDEHDRHREEIFNAYPGLRPLFVRMQKESGLRENVRATAEQLVRYTNETGLALDVAGLENMVLNKKGDTWSFKALDVLPPIDLKLAKLEQMAKKMKSQLPLDTNETSIGMNVMNTIRFINALAFIAEIPGRVHLPAAAHDIPAAEWRRIFQARWSPNIAKPVKPPKPVAKAA